MVESRIHTSSEDITYSTSDDMEYRFITQKLPPWHKRFVDLSLKRGVPLEKFRDNKFLQDKGRQFFVAIHEVGHKRVAEGLGWFVHEINIKGFGDVLGFVRASPPPGIGLIRYLRQRSVLAFGGRAATGSDAGTGSDMAQARYINNLRIGYNLANIGSETGQLSAANSLVGTRASLEEEALGLMDKAA